MRKLASFMGLMLLILTTSIFTSCKEPKPEPKVYTVTFDAAGGSEVAAIKVKSGEKAIQPEEPTKEGYVFDAWYNGEAKYDWETPVTANLTLTAKWTDKTYTVTFDVEGIEDQEVKHKEKVTKPAEDPTKEGFVFAGWLNGETAYDFELPVTSDLALTAKWDVVKYSITFDVEGVKAIEVEHGKVAEEPAAPTKDGYTFKGWMNGETAYDWTKAVTADVKLTASWEATKYTITYELPDGVKTDNPATYTIEEEVALKDATVPEGKYFGGWFTDKDYKTPATSIVKGSTGDKTFYAKLNDNPTFTLTLMDGETEYFKVKVEEGKVAEKPTDPTKDGYTFKGWMNGDAAYDWTAAVKADLTLKAEWEINKYTVTIDGKEQTVVYGTKLTKPDDPAAVEGKEFKGWYNGKEPYDWTKPVTSNLSLTQKWDVVKYKITFDVEGVKAIEVEYGKVATEPEKPTKEGHTFEAWMNGKVVYDWTAKVKSNLTLTASWKINEYTVTFNSDGGSAVAAAKVKYNETVKEPAAPTKVGFNFDGWYNGDTKFDFTTKITKDLTLKAQWKAEVVEPEYSSIVNVTKEDNVYSFADGTYQFIEEDGNSILKFGMPEGTEFKAGDTIKITGTINFGEDTPYKQCFIQTLDEAGTAMFGWDMIQVADWDNGRLSGDVKVNKSFVIADDYSPNYCKFQMNAPHDGEAAMYPIVTLKDVKITYIPYVAGAELDFWVAEDENGYDFGTGCDYAKGIKIDASTLQAGDILTFYYALGNVENDYGVYSQIKLGRGYDGSTLPGWTDAGANEWGQINVNGSSYSYELTEADITHIASESETGDYKLLMVFGHNVILSKITTK